MKKSLYIAAAATIMLGICSCASSKKTAEQSSASAASYYDTIGTVNADRLLEEYLEALDHESIDSQISNVDYIIETSGTDSVFRRHVALKIYDHYKGSCVMGAENVTVHVTDKWFATGLISMRSKEELIAAKMYAELNRQSLIGEKAPTARFTDSEYGIRIIPEDCKGIISILYFYDDSCPVCSVESIRLKSFIEGYSGEAIRLYAIYTGQNEEIWRDYFSQKLPSGNVSAEVINLWDPGMKSDFPRIYGVISTPKMFLLDKQGIIAGRNLDTPALAELIDRLSGASTSFSPDEMRTLVDIAMSTYDNKDCNSVKDIVNILGKQMDGKSTAEKTSFMGALFYELKNRDEYCYKCGAEYLAKKEILGHRDIWDVGMISDAELFVRLFNLAPLGEQVQDFPLPDMKGTLYSIESPVTVFYVYSDSCKRCNEELPLLKDLEKEYKGKVRFIAIDSDNYDVESYLLDYYDISVLPAIFVVGQEKHLYAKYLGAEQLGKLLAEILQ